MSTFTQEVKALPNGKVQFLADRGPLLPPELRTGYQLTAHFAVDRQYGHWGMTHLPSGCHVSGASPRNLKDARRLAERLETIAAWGRYKNGRRPSRAIHRRCIDAGLLKPLQAIG